MFIRGSARNRFSKVAFWPLKKIKKIEKKACHSPGPSAKSDTGGQKGLIKRSKKN